MECEHLARIPWLRHAFSTRVIRSGDRGAKPAPTGLAGLNLGFVEGDSRSRVEANRRVFLRSLGVETLTLAGLRQVHSSVIYRVWTEGAGHLRYVPSGSAAAHQRGNALPSGDALLTDQPGVLLSVRTADCVPILLVDTLRRAVAAVHAGWRGSLERIAEKTVNEMRRESLSQPEDLVAAIGPSIRARCYEVGQEVVEAFCGRFARSEAYFKQARASNAARPITSLYPLPFLSAWPPGHGPDSGAAAHLDLVAVTRDQLRNAGLRSTNIHVANFCTACRTDLFFSHRKEGATGRMMAVISVV